MARLKVKQISDFTTAVQNLIDNDADQNATIIGNISTALSNEASDTNSDVVSIDAVLGTIATGSQLTDVSNALADEISNTNSDVVSLDSYIDNVSTGLGNVSDALADEIIDTNSDVVSLDSYIDGVSSDLADELSNTNSDIVSLEGVDTALSGEIATEKGRIDAILAGSTTDLDAFAEVISYVNSLDTADGGALTSQIASIDARVSLNTSSDAALSAALAGEISDTNSDVASIDAVLGTIATGSQLTDVSNELADVSDALVAEIADTNSDVTSLDAYIDGVSGDLAAEISNTNSDVVSLDAYIDGVSGDLAAEITATNSDVVSLDSYIDDVSADLAAEITATNSDVTSIDGAIDSVETLLDGFAKEAFVQAITSDIVGGGSGTGSINGPAGDTTLAGSVGNWSENGVGTVTFDLNDPIEGNNIAEYQQNLVSMTVNGLEVGHNFLRIGGPTTVHLDSGSLFGGAALEPDDVIEFKYIKD